MVSYFYALAISLATVPIPFVGAKLFFPLAILVAFFQAKKYDLYKITSTLSLLLIVGTTALIFQNDPFKILIILYCSLSISFVLFDFEIEEKHWLYTAYILIGFFVISLLSIIVLDYDIIAKFIYGESRHEIGAFSLISFRGSGLYQEPSTFAYHLIAIVCILHLSKPEAYLTQKCIILLFSLFSFSAAAVVALLFFIYLIFQSPIKAKIKIAIFALSTPAVIYLGYVVINFLLYKVNIYMKSEVTEVTRFQAVGQFLDTVPLLGLNAEQLAQLVIFDMGPFISSILIFGVLALPICLTLLYCCVKNLPSIFVFLTKIPLTDPLLWYLVNRVIRHKKNGGINEKVIS